MTDELNTRPANIGPTGPAYAVTLHPHQPLLDAITELQCLNNGLHNKLNRAHRMIESGAFKYTTPVHRKALLDALIDHADKVDDSARAIIKGMRQIKRAKIRDDDVIAMLAHSYANGGGNLSDLAANV